MMEATMMRSDLRNLHLHRAALAKLKDEPSLRQTCLELLERWLAAPESRPSRPWLERWRQLLQEASDDELARVVLDPEGGQVLRSCSPLAPVLTPRERWARLAELRSRTSSP